MVDAVILGAGVIGLSIALELHSRGYKVAVVAKDLPDDSDSVGFASPWAGCNWFPFKDDGSMPESIRERKTFAGLTKLAEEYPDLCAKIPFYKVWDEEKEVQTAWYEDLVEKIQHLVFNPSDPEPQPLPGKKRFGQTFSSFIMDAPAYTAHLGRLVQQKDIQIIRKRLSSLDQAYSIPELDGEAVNLVINATGLGAKSLIGVQDDLVHPARGQTVLVHAPGVKSCIMHVETFGVQQKPGEPQKSEPAYIIPRPGPKNHVILGGTYIENDYSTLVDIPTAQRILRDCWELEPKLAPPGGTWEDIEVVSHNVGLRPARVGGPRIELEHRKLREGKGVGSGMKDDSKLVGREVAVVHAYGFGSSGFQQSLGAAQEVADIVDGYLKPKST